MNIMGYQELPTQGGSTVSWQAQLLDLSQVELVLKEGCGSQFLSPLREVEHPLCHQLSHLVMIRHLTGKLGKELRCTHK